MRLDKTDMYCHPEVDIHLKILKAEGREEEYRNRYTEPPYLQGDDWHPIITLNLQFTEHSRESLLEKLDQFRIALEMFLDGDDELELSTANRLEGEA